MRNYMCPLNSPDQDNIAQTGIKFVIFYKYYHNNIFVGASPLYILG